MLLDVHDIHEIYRAVDLQAILTVIGPEPFLHWISKAMVCINENGLMVYGDFRHGGTPDTIIHVIFHRVIPHKSLINHPAIGVPP